MKAGANVNAVGDGGWTALLNGAHSGDHKVVKVLLKAGADPFAQLDVDLHEQGSVVEKTALDLAKDNSIQQALKREMERRIAAALSVMPVEVPLRVRQEAMRLVYS